MHQATIAARAVLSSYPNTLAAMIKRTITAFEVDVPGNHGGDDAWNGKLDNVGTSVSQKALGGTAEEQGVKPFEKQRRPIRHFNQ